MKRAKTIEEAIRLVWDSLESHLKWTHTESTDGVRFHKTCIKEYARLIELLSELY